MSSKLFGRSFVLLWFSETAFDLGAELTYFALGVWVFSQNNSVQEFSYSILASTIPAILFSPLGAVLADRFDRRWVVAIGDIASAIMTIILAYLVFTKLLTVQHMYIVSAIGGTIGALRKPSFKAAVAAILPRDRVTQANGVLSSTLGVLQVGAPVAAGYLLSLWGLEALMMIEVVLVLAGAATLFSAFNSASHAIRGYKRKASATLLNLIGEVSMGVHDYFKEYPSMKRVTTYILIQGGLVVLAGSLITPLVLASHSSEILGWVMSLGAVGSICGSLVLTARNIQTNLMQWILISDFALSCMVVFIGYTTVPMVWYACAFGAFFFSGISGGCASALWMIKVPHQKLGSMYSFLSAANKLVMVIILLGGSALIDHVLEPQMKVGAPLAQFFESWFGIGKGRGVALLFVAVGVVFATVSAIALLHPQLKKLDALVPDQMRAEEG